MACAPLRVWLDDDLEDRAAPVGWTHVTTAWQAIRLLDTGAVVELSLDNDLGDDRLEVEGGAGQGKLVVDWLCEQQFLYDRLLWPAEGITLHTANSTARDQMARAIERYAGQTVGVKRLLTRGGKPRFLFGAASARS
jgi:hypothetical protein